MSPEVLDMEDVSEPHTKRDVSTKNKNKSSIGEKLKKNLLFIGLAVGIVLVILIIIIVSVVLTRNKEDVVNTEFVSNRIDCLPWMRGKDLRKIKTICMTDEYFQKCMYQPNKDDKNSPACFYDMSKVNLELLNEEETQFGMRYLVGDGVTEGKGIKIEFENLDDTTLRFKISDAYEVNYEVPLLDVYKPSVKTTNTKYKVEINNEKIKFGFRIIRKSTGTVLWDTNLGPIIFEKLQREITTKLPSTNVYGFGENMHKSFKHDFDYQNWPVFARDQIAEDVPYTNLYGSQPFYTCMENDGQSHGVVLVNSNAFDYEFIPAPGLTYRVSGGVLDFYMFLGPNPESVVQQYTKYFGRTFMPPYWALGFQISRYGYLDLDDMKQVLERFQEHDIPLDTQVADIDHYDERKDFTVDPDKWKDLPNYFEYLKEVGMKTVMILDPALIVNNTDYWPYETGKEKDIFIRWPGVSPDFADTNSSIMLGYCWPNGKVAYPDFFKESTKQWWIDSIERHYKDLFFDGLWIDMNEPAVFGTNEERAFNWPVNDRPYWTLKCPDNEYETVKIKASYLHSEGNKLSDKTLCMKGVQGENNEFIHYDVHNLYGLSESIPTFEAAKKVTGTRGFVITRSTFIGSGKYGGHWTGDNHSLWSHLHYSIIGMLEFNLFGIPYVGADICGFFGKVTPELCARWSALGAFYPFSRNHNGIGEINQDPGALGEPVISAARNALRVRYTILPYYYTLFYKAHKFGNTVARPLHFEFPKDNNTYSIDRQFLIGPAFLITPVLDEGKATVNGYFPAENWYNYYTGEAFKFEQNSTGNYETLTADESFIPLHVRGGYIIPTQEYANTTHYSRKNPFGLIVAPNDQGEAFGDLFYDDGMSENLDENHFFATFTLRDNKLRMSIEHNTYPGMDDLVLDKVIIYLTGAKSYKSQLKVTLNGALLNKNKIQFDNNQIILKNLELTMVKSFELVWSTDLSSLIKPSKTIVDCSLRNPPLNKNECELKGCLYSSVEDDTPRCYIPEKKGGYKVTGQTDLTYSLERADKDFELVPGDKPIQNLKLIVKYGSIEGKHRMANIKIVDADDSSRYEVPLPLNYEEAAYDDTSDIQIEVGNSVFDNLFQLKVNNKNKELLFNTETIEQAFVYNNQFLQMYMNLGYKNLYGMGENSHYSFKHEFSYGNWWGVFARDQPPGAKKTNLYGTHPFFMAVDEKTGRAFGVFIQNSNAQEYAFLPPQSVAYRTLGGVLDFYIIEESSPEKLIQAYTSLIGKPYMPPYWSLGFQLCKYGYNTLENLQAAVDRTLDAKIPLDIQYADIDHFDDNLDFTYDKVRFNGLPEYIKQLKAEKGVYFIIILDPAINSEAKDYPPYINGKNQEVYMKWPKNENPQLDEIGGNNPYMLGYVWPSGKTAFPDFFKEKTKNWWKKEIKDHYNSVSFDGLWIDMNEPANFDTNEPKPWNWPEEKPDWNLFCGNNTYDDPPYLPLIATLYGANKKISDKTMCMIGLQGNQDEHKHYDVHNLYGWSQSEPTLDALRDTLNKRSIVISRSTYPSSGKYAGHWLGDNTSIWPHLKQNIIGLLEFNLFGIPYVGADICGFFEDATPEMCTRWMQIGAFQPFYRNHNGFNGINQDPAALGADVADASREVTEIRYTLLPFLYTLFYEANLNGGSVVRSLMHEFPTDVRTLEIDRQFMWGSWLLISPVLDLNKRTVYAYFPHARWFDYYTGKEVIETGRIHELDAPLDYIPLHIRGGALIVTTEHAVNTDISRTRPYGLIVAPSESSFTATTKLFVDNGDEIDYNTQSSEFEFNYTVKDVKEHTLEITEIRSGYTLLDTNTFDTLRLLGVESAPSQIEMVSGGSTSRHYDFEYNKDHKELYVRNLKIRMSEAIIRISLT